MNKPRITVQQLSNSPGLEWLATYHGGDGAGWGIHGSTAIEAETKLRTAYPVECEGITATVEAAVLIPIKDTKWAVYPKRLPAITDEQWIAFGKYTDARAKLAAGGVK